MALDEGNTVVGTKLADQKLQVAEEVEFMCDCLEYYGIDLINGGTATESVLETLFDEKHCTPILGISESVIDYALGHGMLIDVEDLSKNKSSILPIAVGRLGQRYTYNPFWNTGIPAELLEYGNNKYLRNSSPRQRIEEIKNIINLSYENLDELQDEYNDLVRNIESVSIDFVETQTIANKMKLVEEAKSVVDGYRDDELQKILGLDSETVSDRFYYGKLVGGDLSQKDIDAYRTHLKQQDAAEERAEFFKSAMSRFGGKTPISQ